MHSGNAMRTRLSLLLIALLALPLLAGQGGSAQSPEAEDAVSATPIPVEFDSNLHVDMSTYCAAIGTPTALAATTDATPELFLYEEGGQVLQGNWQLPDGSFLTTTGDAVWLEAIEGIVTVVSCGAPLVYSLATESATTFALPAGTGLLIDSASGESIVLRLFDPAGTVSIVAQDGGDSQIYLEVLAYSDEGSVCTEGQCWNASDLDPIVVDGGDEPPGASPAAAPTPGPRRSNVCGIFRC